MACSPARSGPTWALMAVALWGSATAQGAPPQVLIVPYQPLQPDLPDSLSDQTTGIIAREVRHGGAQVMVSEPRPGRSRARNRVEASVGRAEQLLASGREAMASGNMAKAVKRLRRAAATLEEAAPGGVDLSLLPEVWLALGVASFRDGEEAEADAALARAVFFAPERRLSPSDYPPVFVREYEEARAAVLQRSRGKIDVPSPAGARVWLDGRSVGRAPVVMTEVLPGTHWIRVEGPFGTRTETVRVRPDEDAQTRFAEEEVPEADPEASLRAGRLTPAALQNLRSRARARGAEWILLGVIKGTSTAYEIRSALVHAPTGEVGELANLAFDLDFLSAEIEVYKLAADLQKQIAAGKLAAPVSDGAWRAAPEVAEPRRDPTGPRRFRAAPPAPFVRNKPLAAAPRVETEPAAPKELPRPEPFPEVTSPPRPAAEDLTQTAPPNEPPSAQATTESEGGDLWWVWVLVGVAAVGAAGAATAVVVSEQDAEQGSLRIRW
ncbi:MAG: PEGA domain-containing protein [Myxococcota bacterium]